jgi:hypothetical protein
VSLALLVVLAGNGLGIATFGQPRAAVVSTLTTQLGRPTAAFVNSGCGARYREVEWGRLYVEFRSGRFNGYRYLSGRWLGTGPAQATTPRLATARRITLGSSFAAVGRAFGRLNLVGTDRFAAPNGIVFYRDRGRVVEIKTGTCGDF